jgi:Protein of unknown function (DUF3800)
MSYANRSGGAFFTPQINLEIPSVEARFFGSPAVAQVWAPVSGVAPKYLPGWSMLMLQAFIDDSREEKPPIFVLAGYIAPVSRWADFSKEWQEVLDMPPRIPYFHSNKIRHMLGKEKAYERIGLLHAVIEKYITAGFSIMVPPDAIKRIWGKDKFASHPLYCAFEILIPNLGFHVKEFGFKCDKIELYFDEQMKEKDRIIKAWDWARKHANLKSLKLKNILTKTPRFENDKDFNPLQAADLRWMRRRYVERATKSEKLKAPWASKHSIKYMAIEVTDDQLRERFQQIRANHH